MHLILLIHIVAFAGWALCSLIFIYLFLRKGYKQNRFWLIAIGIIAVGGLFFRIYMTDREIKIFYDEYDIINSSKALASERVFYRCQGGTIENCEVRETINRTTGHIFVGAAAIVLTGKDTPELFFSLNAVLGMFSILLIAALAFSVAEDIKASAYAAAIVSAMPLHLTLSANASSEMLNLTLVCSTWIFFFAASEKEYSVPLRRAGVLFSLICAMLTRPENVLLPPMMLAAMAFFPAEQRKSAMKTRVALLAIPYLFLIPLADIYLSTYLSNRAHFDSMTDRNIFKIIISNINFVIWNKYLSAPFIAPVILAFAAFKKERNFKEYILLVYSGIWFFYLCFMNVNIYQGDLPRTLLVMSAPVAVLSGAALKSALGHRNSVVKTMVIAMCFVPFVFFNPKPPLFHPAMTEFNHRLKSLSSVVPDECIVLTTNPSIVYIHAKNKSYLITDLFKEDFFAEHPECKVIMYDILCRYRFITECEIIKEMFPQKTLFSESYPLFDYELSLILERESSDSAEQPIERTPSQPPPYQPPLPIKMY